MKQRLTSWVLAVLLALSAGLSAPSARVVASREESRIVCVHRAKRVEREVVESQTPRPPFASTAVWDLTTTDTPQLSTALDRELFQRPPPSFPRS